MSRCFAKGCNKTIASKHLMCGVHWRQVPADLQKAVYDAYKPGRRPSREWVKAALAAQNAVAEVDA